MSPETTRPNLIERILNWLRAGYPQGVPQQDYVALFGILHRQLTPAEVEAISRSLAEERGHENLSDADIRAAIEKHALQQPTDEDVARVSSRLAAGGWPLASDSLAD